VEVASPAVSPEDVRERYKKVAKERKAQNLTDAKNQSLSRK
jgi:hypothetical protein